jgi:hypothetical protein
MSALWATLTVSISPSKSLPGRVGPALLGEVERRNHSHHSLSRWRFANGTS